MTTCDGPAGARSRQTEERQWINSSGQATGRPVPDSEQLIGAGGMANVYKAADLKENRLVAVKILRRGMHAATRSSSGGLRTSPRRSRCWIIRTYRQGVRRQRDGQAPVHRDGVRRRHHAEGIHGVPQAQPLTYKETLHFITQTFWTALQSRPREGHRTPGTSSPRTSCCWPTAPSR